MNDFAREELEALRIKNNGFLRPQEVLEFARDDTTELHKFFEWNDSEAAEKYRLAQARALIRVSVVVAEGTNERVRAYVSLSNDRHPDGGYRAFAEVLSDEIMTETLLADALKELSAFQRKYNRLKAISELSPVFDAIEAVTPKEFAEENRVSA